VADQRLALGLLGCGGMGQRHIQGMAELHRAGLSPFDLVAVCDAQPQAAAHAADVAEQELGRRPAICHDLNDLLSGATGRHVDAVDLVTDANTHHTLGCAVLQAGKHVMCEKPLGLTVRACRLLVETAERYGVVLATAENYRRDPINRMIKAVLDSGAIGEPRMVLQESVGGGRSIAITPWRHLKERGGIVLDMGVHYTDILRYLIGPIERISGRVALFEPLRYPTPLNEYMTRFYGSTNALATEPMQATAEDTGVGAITFAQGALGHWLLSQAGHGQNLFLRRIYGSEGSLDAPSDRSRRPVRLYGGRSGSTAPDGVALTEADIAALVPDFALDEVTARLFGAPVLASYDRPFEVTDRSLLALELEDFGRAIRDGRAPEVDGLGGLEAVAAVYAFFESSALGREVTLDEVVSGATAPYQHTIDAALGLA